MFEEEEEEEDEEDEDDIAWECRSRRIHVHSPGVWKHSTVTAMADADQSRRDPGIPPAGGDRDFSKQPPPSQPVGSKPGPGVGRGLSRGPMPDADGPNTKCPPLLGSNGARLAHERKLEQKACRRRPPLVFTLQYVLYLVLELRTLQDHQDLDC